MDQTDVRVCPHCGGEIKTAARICKHCKKSVPEYVVPAPPAPPQPKKQPEVAKPKLLTCEACENPVSAAAKACPKCGHPVRVCPLCGQSVPQTASACPNCGHPYETQAGATLETVSVGTRGNVGAPLSGPAANANTVSVNRIDWKVALICNCVTAGILTWSGFLAASGNYWYRYHDGDMVAGLLALGSLVVTLVFFCILLYRCWSVVANDSSPVSPAKALGFLFIPFFNFYWFFVAFPKLSLLLNERAGSLGMERRTSYGLGIAFAILTVAAMAFGFLSGAIDADRDVEEGLAAFSALADIASFIIWILFFKDVARVAEEIRVAGGGK